MTSMTRLAVLAATAFSTLFLVAAASKPLTTVQDAETIEFTLDPVHCMVNFRIHHAGAGMFWGRFNDVTGTFNTSEDGAAAPSTCRTTTPGPLN